MARNIINWIARLVQYPTRFQLTDLGGGVIELTPDPGTITQAGTPVNPENMNSMMDEIVNSVCKDGDRMNGTLEFIDANRRIKRIGAGGGLALENIADILVIAAKTFNYNAVNAVFDGTNWSRIDTSKPAALIYLDWTTGKFYVKTAAAGANPIAWSGPYTVWHSGNDGENSGLDADLLRGLNPGQIFSYQGRVSGTWIDQTTTVAPKATYTKRIPLGVAGCTKAFVRLWGSYNSSYLEIEATTNANEAISRYWAYSSSGGVRKDLGATYLSYSRQGIAALYCYVADCWIDSVTNELVITIYNGDASDTFPLDIKFLDWRAW